MMNPAPLARPGFLQTRGVPIWAIITGNVRSGREFKGIFSKILDLRDRGLIDGIRLVTWKGELEAAPGLEQTLVELGISILVVDPPPADPKVHPLFHGYVYHQRKSLHFALESLPADAYVLKARTDFAEERFDSMVEALFGNPSLELETGIAAPLFETRLFSYDARSDYLFYWDDIVFSGMKADLLKMNNFDLAGDFIYPGHTMPAECRLFAPLFIQHYPVLRWFFENIDGREFARLLQLWLPFERERPLPDLTKDILAAYFHILTRYVLLPNTGPFPKGAIRLGHFFAPDESWGVKSFDHPWASHKLHHRALLDQLRTDVTFGDRELDAIATRIRRMDSDLASRGALSPRWEADRLEFSKFAEHFGVRLFTPQSRLIPASAPNGKSTFSTLAAIHLPEKRHPSWWARKTTGFRRSAANFLLGKVL